MKNRSRRIMKSSWHLGKFRNSQGLLVKKLEEEVEVVQASKQWALSVHPEEAKVK
jgi:hypothetical protein